MYYLHNRWLPFSLGMSPVHLPHILGHSSWHGSLCNMREQIRCNQVNKDIKVFSVGDKFVVHWFKAHLSARTCTMLGLQSTSDNIPHEKSLTWLQSTAEKRVSKTLMPTHTPSSDILYSIPSSSFSTIMWSHQTWEWATYCETRSSGCQDWNWAEKKTVLWSVYTRLPTCVRSYQAPLTSHLSFIAIYNRTVKLRQAEGNHLIKWLSITICKFKDIHRTGLLYIHVYMYL